MNVGASIHRFLTAPLARGAALWALSIVAAAIAAPWFSAMRAPDVIVAGPGVTGRRWLSAYHQGLSRSAGDTEVFVLEGPTPGGTVLVLGGTHADEPAGYLAAVVLVEHARAERGRLIVIPRANASGFTHNVPQEGHPQSFLVATPGGARRFTYGARATNPVHQWPDPQVYTLRGSGQMLSGTETRNLNRAYPGRATGNLTEQIAFAITRLIRQEHVGLALDLHEASPEYPVVNTIVAHQRAMDLAALANVGLQEGGIDIGLEASPEGLHGLSHREWGDQAGTLAVLMETADPAQGRLRGRTDARLVVEGRDRFYESASASGRLSVPFDARGWPLDQRVGRHLSGVAQFVSSLAALAPEDAVVLRDVPDCAAVTGQGVGAFLAAPGEGRRESPPPLPSATVSGAATRLGRVAEPATLAAMLACFAVLGAWRKWPIGFALLASAWAGAAFNGDLVPVRHLVEGAFSYLDPLLVIATAMVFMQVLADGGALNAIGASVVRRFASRPVLLLPALMLIVMFPGMITGSSTAAVLTTGTMVGSIVVGLGLSRERAGALIAMGGVLGMIAPPVNIPAMLIGSGIDLPYVGFAAPLALAAFPLALVVGYGLGWPLFGRAGGQAVVAGGELPVWRALLAPGVAAVLMAAPRIWPQQVVDPGLPLTFVVSAVAAAACTWRRGSRAVTAGGTLLRAVEESLPVLGILVGVGAFIQVMTFTGARGWLVSLMLAAPAWATIAAAALGIPLFGAVSAFGSASVLGVPFLLVMLGRDEVVTTAALSSLAALGDLMLPAALSATLAAQATGVDDRRKVLRLCVLPACAVAAVAVAMLLFSTEIGRLWR